MNKPQAYSSQTHKSGDAHAMKISNGMNIIFHPILGPLLHQLENEITARQQMLCLVTPSASNTFRIVVAALATNQC